MKRMLWIIALLFVAGYLAICLTLYGAQAYLIYHPTRAIRATPEQLGLAYERVTLHAGDGAAIDGWFVPAEHPRATILFCHGNGGNCSHCVDAVALYHRLGLSTFIFDYRGYGLSGGAPSEQGMYDDAAIAWGYLTETRGIAPSEIILFGRSLGGAVASHLALDHPSAGLVLESTFTSIPEMGAAQFPWLPVRWLTRYRYDNLANVKRIARPLLVIHSRDDGTIPYEQGRALYAAAAEPKMFLEISHGHNDGYFRSGALYTDGIDRFLREKLGR